MKRVLLVVGADGMLGGDVVEASAEEFDVVPTTLEDLDLTDMVRLRQVFRKHKPDLVVNAAAFTDVDGCETNQDLAYKANTVAARNVAVQAERFGAELIHISTDYVFDGEKEEPYTEFDPVSPRGVYACSKAAAEELVRTLCRRHYILRVSVLFGPRRKNFVDAVVDRARKGEDIQVPVGRVGCPTYTWDVAEAVSYLAGSERFGTYHFNQGEAMSRLEFARRILAAQKLGGMKIEEKPVEALGEVAPRPRHADLSMRQWRLEGFTTPRTLDEALEHYFARKAGDGVTQDWRREGLIKKIEAIREIQRKRQEAWVPRKEMDRERDEGSERRPPRRHSAYDEPEEGSSGRPPGRDDRGGPRAYQTGGGPRPYQTGRAPRPYQGGGGPRPYPSSGGPRPFRGGGGPRPFRGGGAPRPYQTGGGPRPYQTGGAPRPYQTGEGSRPFRDGDAPRRPPDRGFRPPPGGPRPPPRGGRPPPRGGKPPPRGGKPPRGKPPPSKD